MIEMLRKIIKIFDSLVKKFNILLLPIIGKDTEDIEKGRLPKNRRYNNFL